MYSAAPPPASYTSTAFPHTRPGWRSSLSNSESQEPPVFPRATLVSAVGAAALTLGVASPAHADHGELDTFSEMEEACGQVLLTFVNNTDHVYFADYRVTGEEGAEDEHSGHVPSSGAWEGTALGPVYNSTPVPAHGDAEIVLEFTEDTEVSYWINRGPEDNAYVGVETATVEACQDRPEEAPTESSSPEPAETPAPEPTERPGPEPTADPTQGPGDWESDWWKKYVGLHDPAPEGTHPGQFCKDDEAGVIFAHTETTVIQCLYNEDSERQHWVEIDSYDDLVLDLEVPTSDPDEPVGPGTDGPQQDGGKDLPARSEASDRTLPVTGGSLAGLVTAAMVAVGSGGAALLMARARRTAAEEGTESSDA